MSNDILFDVSDGIARLTLNRPEKKNAMSFSMLGEFIDILSKIGKDNSVRVLIIQGSQGAFCSGTDLSDLDSIPGDDRGLRGSASDHDRWWPIVECPVPVIAAIDGPAVGMGAEFTSQCDIRIATPNARFSWNFSHRGLVPDTGAGSWILPRLIGPGQALKLLYTGEFISAEDAFDLGYVQEIVQPEELQKAALDMAIAIGKGSSFSHKRIKNLVFQGLGSDVDEHMERHTKALTECFKSKDHEEGVKSFLERRAPNFIGE